LIGWTSTVLAEKSGVGLMTVRRYEAASGLPDGRIAQLMKIKNALEAAGIEFLGDPIESPGVRLRR